MNAPSEFKMDLSESFPHLENAPVVEAVIQVGTKVGVPWEEAEITQKLKPRLPEYPRVVSQRDLLQEIKLDPGQLPAASTSDMGWAGLRFESLDRRNIAQFNRDGFVFSRLSPYQDWEWLREEALRLWAIYKQVARPGEVQRLGVRFINKVVFAPERLDFEEFLQQPPRPPQGLELPYLSFFHQDTLAVPGHPYAINVARTIQRSQPPEPDSFAIILDIDVSMTKPFEPTDAVLKEHLAVMRWLKNKAFFGSITEKMLEKIR